MSDNYSEPNYTNEDSIVINLNHINYLSPSKSHNPTPASTPNIMPTITDLGSNGRQLFNSKFLAALINKDSILRECRDCNILNDEERCRKFSKQVQAHCKSLSTKNGCLFVDNRVEIPAAKKRQLRMYFRQHIPKVGE